MKRWAIAGAAAAALVVGATGLAASRATPSGDALGPFFLGPKMARSEVIMVYGGAVHDWRIDQGRVVGVRSGAVELSERDGTRALVQISPLARVTLDHKLALLTDITRGMTALVARDGAAPATTVRLTSRRAGVR